MNEIFDDPIRCRKWTSNVFFAQRFRHAITCMCLLALNCSVKYDLAFIPWRLAVSLLFSHSGWADGSLVVVRCDHDIKSQNIQYILLIGCRISVMRFVGLPGDCSDLLIISLLVFSLTCSFMRAWSEASSWNSCYWAVLYDTKTIKCILCPAPPVLVHRLTCSFMFARSFHVKLK